MRRMEVVWIMLFVLSWFPIGMLAATTMVGGSETYTYDFSIYNENWNGLSEFRTQIEATGREVKVIQSSVSVASRYEGDAVLVIMGPVKDFTIEAILVIIGHMLNGGSVLIADDFGTANSSLYLLNQLMAQQMTTLPSAPSGLVAFTKGVLLDLNSYDVSPKLPIIIDFRASFDGGDLTNGVTSLHLNWATALSPRSVLGMAGVAWTTERAWCDTNISDPSPFPDGNEWNGSLPVVGAIDFNYFAQTAGPARMVAVSDPSLFDNDMIDRGGASGNRRFAANLIEWISAGNTSLPFLFCEGLLAVPWQSMEFFFSLYMGRVFWLSTLPYFSALYPLVTLVGIRKYLPEPKKPDVKSVSEVFLRRGQTYFGERLAYYRSEGNYTRVVKMLHRKLMRDLKRKYGWTDYDSRRVWDELRKKDTKVNEQDFFNTMTRIEELSASPTMKIRESEMMNLFFFIQNIQSILIEARK